jgi:hypothetical protein
MLMVNPTKTTMTIKSSRSPATHHGISHMLKTPTATTKSSVLSVITDSTKCNNAAYKFLKLVSVSILLEFDLTQLRELALILIEMLNQSSSHKDGKISSKQETKLFAQLPNVLYWTTTARLHIKLRPAMTNWKLPTSIHSQSFQEATVLDKPITSATNVPTDMTLPLPDLLLTLLLNVSPVYLSMLNMRVSPIWTMTTTAITNPLHL